MIWRDPRWFTFDWISGEQLLVRTLADEEQIVSVGAARGESHFEARAAGFRVPRASDPWRGRQPMTAPLEPFKFVLHFSKAKSGLPIRGGLARAAGWSYLFKNYVLKDWVTFAEVFGQPLRLGKYGAGATDSDKQALLSAVANIGTDAAAIVPDSMLIEFVEARQTGTAELYERFCEYLDRQVSKAVLGQTLTTEVPRNSGSRAAAQVHDAVRRDILAADARRLSETLTRDLVKPIVDLNCGPQPRYPRLDLILPNDQNDREFADVIAELVDRGLRIGQNTVLDRLGLPTANSKEACSRRLARSAISQSCTSKRHVVQQPLPICVLRPVFSHYLQNEIFHPYGRPYSMSHSRTMNDSKKAAAAIPTDTVAAAGGTQTTTDIERAPEWIQLLPTGEFVGRDNRGPFRVSNAEVVIAATDALGMEAGLPIDYDHATDFAAPAGRRAPAAGWIRAIETRKGALWGNVEWTTHGNAAVVTHEYRYISPVFEYSQDGEVRRILRAALTNNPNLYLTAISVRGSTDEVITEGPIQQIDIVTASAAPKSTTVESTQAQLREMLGLTIDTTPEMIVEEVRKVLGARDARIVATANTRAAGASTTIEESIVADPARYVPIEQFESTVTELNQLRAATARERAAMRVDVAMKAGKIVPAQREWAIAYCQANADGFESFVARQPALMTGMVTTQFEGTPSSARNYESRGTSAGGRQHRMIMAGARFAQRRSCCLEP